MGRWRNEPPPSWDCTAGRSSLRMKVCNGVGLLAQALTDLAFDGAAIKKALSPDIDGAMPDSGEK